MGSTVRPGKAGCSSPFLHSFSPFIYHMCVFGYPNHASCNISWNIPLPCSTFKEQLVQQFKLWEGPGLCPNETTKACPEMPCGQNCLYELSEVSDSSLVGTHTTTVHRYIDDMSFDWKSDGIENCKVTGFSTSRTWYAVLDLGTNYCNLRNLIDGAKISATNGFREDTRNDVCTQYTS